MSLSKIQQERPVRVCKCGCEQEFRPFPIRIPLKDGGGHRIPEYIRGHHPGPKSTMFGNGKPAWNKGLKKSDHPSIARMGFQPGHAPFNDWSKVNFALKNNPEVRERWLASKKGQAAWNKGLTKFDFANPDYAVKPPSKRGPVADTRAWKEMRRVIQRRDNFTCQQCGDRNHKGRGSRIRLEVHHIVSVFEDPSRAFDPSNLTLLCADCHRKTHNFGSKALVHRSGL
jgi:hypothetical protein